MPINRMKSKTRKTDIPIMQPSLPPLEDYVKRIRGIWDSHMLTNFGANAIELEEKAQRYLGNSYVRVVSSCDTALILALAALEIPRGSECIVTPFTFNSTINAIIWNNLRPRFVDIDPYTFNIDPKKVERAVTRSTKAIVATHVFGNPCDIKELRAIADEHELNLVFDAAHAYGALYENKKIGSFGDMEAFSLSGTKLVTGGEGGLLATPNAEYARRIEFLRNYGFYGDYNSLYVGLNGKLSELNAALACLTIDTIDDAIEKRNRIARLYKTELERIDGISFQHIHKFSVCAYKDFGMRILKQRDSTQRALATSGIQTKKYFMPAHHMPAFKDYYSGSLPITEKLYEEILCLPIFNDMEEELVLDVCKRVTSELRKG